MIQKTASVTAASILGVIVAGGAAIGANIGILNAADDSELGSLSADATIITPTDATAEPDGQPSEGGIAQAFAVDVAGTVDVEADGTGLRVIEVRTNAGWSWEETASSSESVELTFTSSDDTLEFIAYRDSDGTVTARVDRPVATPSLTPATTHPAEDSDEYEHDDHDDEEPEEYEHEGRDDDD
jgi:hypothetical protein